MTEVSWASVLLMSQYDLVSPSLSLLAVLDCHSRLNNARHSVYLIWGFMLLFDTFVKLDPLNTGSKTVEHLH